MTWQAFVFNLALNKRAVMKIVALAGGVGGAKLLDGLANCLAPEDLTAIVNTGDDFDFFGLRICPDLDTVCYTFAGISNPETGWGRSAETWRVLENIKKLGGPDWFRLGDSDLATHLERTRRLKLGETLSCITSHFCHSWGIRVNVIPMSDSIVRTIVFTDQLGPLPFQEYFVLHRCQPVVKSFSFEGIQAAQAAPKVLDLIYEADYVIFCPSNPWVSIDPILNVNGICESLHGKKVIAVSPLIGGDAVKGPASKMFTEMGIKPSAIAVADHYRSFITGFVLDHQDSYEKDQIYSWGIIPFETDILMKDQGDRQRLANEILTFCRDL